MDEHAPNTNPADPLAPLDDWLDDERLTVAQAVLDNGAPTSEAERTVLALTLGEELGMLNVASTQLRYAVDLWHGTRRPIAEFKNGVIELRREEAELAKARSVYNRALGLVKMRVERKAARGAVVDAAVACADGGLVTAEQYELLVGTVAAFLELAPTAPETRDRRKVAA